MAIFPDTKPYGGDQIHQFGSQFSSIKVNYFNRVVATLPLRSA